MARRLSDAVIAPSCSLRYSLRYTLRYGCGRRKRDAEDDEGTKIAELEEEYLANPTPETAMSLLSAKPWRGDTLVRSFLDCIQSV